MKAGRRPRFLAKDDLFKIPVVGSAFRGAKQIPVEPGLGRCDVRCVRRERALTEGEVVVIYPEGTVTTRPDHLPMEGKTGAVRLSLASGRPDHAAGQLGLAGRLAEIGQGQPEVRPPGLGARRASRSTSSAGADEADDPDAAARDDRRAHGRAHALVVDLRDRYPKRWSDDG